MHTHSADAGDNLLMTDPNAAKNGRGDEESCLPRACADGCKRHCPAAVQDAYRQHPRRFHCAACCGVSLIVLLIVIFVGGRAIASSALDAADMKVVKMDITDITDDKFTTHVVMAVDNRFPLKATIKPRAVSMAFNGQKFASIDLPAIHLAAANTTLVNLTDVSVTVGDKAIFTTFGQGLMANKLLSALVGKQMTFLIPSCEDGK